MELQDLISRFRGPLAGLIASWGVPWHDAHELAQDVFVEAYLGNASFRGEASNPEQVGGWLRGIARNLHRMHRRRAWIRRAEPIGDHDLPAPESPEQPEAIVALRRAIDNLPEKLRAVIYMHYLEETGVREVAGLLGVRPKTVEGRLYRARQKLRGVLQAHETPSPLAEAQ